MNKIILLFILIRHGINPLSKCDKVKDKLCRLTDKELYWISIKFGDNLRLIMEMERIDETI